MALAATVVTALISAQGSGAAAADFLPIPAEQESFPATRHFIAEPVIQPLPQALPVENPLEAAAEATGEDGAGASSLAELVKSQPIPASLTGELRCLASAIYFEARGESLDGQLAVGRVVVNRASSGRFPASYCGVVTQPSQFSFVRGRSLPAAREGSQDWREAVAVAQIASAGKWKSEASGALFFHAARVSPGWRLTRLARVDNHVFYR